MTRDVRSIGWWDGPGTPDGWPDVCGFAGAGPPDGRTAAYLRSGTVWAVAAGISRCRLCGRPNGSAELTDGENFSWPEGLAHYVEAHGVRLPDEVREVAARGPARPVDPQVLGDTLLTAVDDGWWRAQARQTTVHLPGCRHSPARCSWDLPTRADIHVDGVPSGDIVLMARLRALLGAGWPFAELRAMIDRQPFLAVTGGDPAALTRNVELRGHLFYATADGLLPVATDL